MRSDGANGPRLPRATTIRVCIGASMHVGTPRGRDHAKSEEQPDAKQITHAPRPEMRSTKQIEREALLTPATKKGRCRMRGGKSPGAPKENRNAYKH
jgi:hypothetical protein